MSKYGVTKNGIVIKRLDEIIEELHDELTDGWGVNTRLNPKSYLNVQITAFADKIAGLWELAEQIYHAMYPYSAEGVNLDNAVQYGGVTRAPAMPSIYPIHAECEDGKIIPAGSVIRTRMLPTHRFVCAFDTEVTRSRFNRVKIRIAALHIGQVYTVNIDGAQYSYRSIPGDTESVVLRKIAMLMTNPEFTVSIADDVMHISSVDTKQVSELILSNNMTTESVTGLVNFNSEEMGNVVMPNGTITQIVTLVPGLISVTNLLPHIPGRLLETDVELRRSYVEKIFARSNRMLESIKSAIFQNVQYVRGVAVYQNDTNTTDSYGRWPHCVEVVVDGGEEADIAHQIWDKKTDGIQTFGSVEVPVVGDEGEPVIIRFNRPEIVYVWFRITLEPDGSGDLPPNYIEAIQEIVLKEMNIIDPGQRIIPQKLIDTKIYANILGIAFIETAAFYTTDPNAVPQSYDTGIIPITPRQRAFTESARIEVLVNDA